LDILISLKETLLLKFMNILHVVNVSFVLPYFLGNQIDYFQKNGDKIYIACSNSEELAEFCEAKGIVFLPIPVFRGINPIADLYALVNLLFFLRTHKIDLIVGHTPKGGMLAMIAGFIYGIRKRIYFRHGLMFETSRGFVRITLIIFEKFTALLASQIICVSESLLNSSIKFNLNSPFKNVIINHGTCNGIDALNRFNPNLINKNSKNDLKLKLGIGENDFVVGYVGRLVNDKGIPELVEGWKLLLSDYNNVKLLLVGPFEDRDGIANLYREIINKSEDIIHIGYSKDTVPYYSIMDLFILPSYREGFPTVVLEASAMELPVITTKNTGCIDSIVENSTGIYCEIQKESICSSISYFLSNRSKIFEFGKNGRTLILEKYLQENVWLKLFDLYHK
jgi:glycosyltransferase involved in cell wall biosynthesis